MATGQGSNRVRSINLSAKRFTAPSHFANAVVIHLDENAHNNRPENLKWGLKREPQYAEIQRVSKGLERARIARAQSGFAKQQDAA